MAATPTQPHHDHDRERDSTAAAALPAAVAEPFELAGLIAEIRENAPREHANWDAKVFDAFIDGPAQRLRIALFASNRKNVHAVKNPGDTDAAVIEAWLRLVREGIARGYLCEKSFDGSFLSCALANTVPEKLGTVPPAERVAVLATIWNLGEGLRAQPQWLDRYLQRKLESLDDPRQLKAVMIAALEPVLAPPPTATWSGPTETFMVNLRDVDAGFLPGRLHMVGPWVVGVTDRRHETTFGLLLKPCDAPEFLGPIDPPHNSASVPESSAPLTGEPTTIRPGMMLVRGQQFELPFLNVVQDYLVTDSGFLIAGAVDSQQLWVAHSP